MPDKPKVALYWCASCGGCDEAVVDLAEDVLGVLEAIDIVLWPVAMDFKKHDIEAVPDGSIFAALINGAIRTSEQEEMVRLLRRKSKVVVSFGACACMGGIPALANQFEYEQIIRYVYDEAPSTEHDKLARADFIPHLNPFPLWEAQEGGWGMRNVFLPDIHKMVRTLDQVIEVEYYLPGCPPTPKLIKEAVGVLLSGNLPPKGAVLAPDVALCEECPRRDTKPADLSLTEFKRPHKSPIDPDKCLLAQGFICMGPATRAGCEALCVRGNMPCSGCFGPTSRVRDQGAKFVSSVASSIAAKEVGEIDATLAGIPDPVGTFYRYGLAKSILRRKINTAPVKQGQS